MGHTLTLVRLAGRRCRTSLSCSCSYFPQAAMAYSFDNRVRYVVRYLYDIDNNGVLDKNDFKCLAVRNTILEAKGEFPADRFAANCKVMEDLWNEIAALADFDKNGEVDVDEFKAAVQVNCVGKTYAQFPPMFKCFIENQFKSIDIDGDGTIGLNEYRQDVITRGAYGDVAEIDEAYNKLCSDADKAAGGLTLARFEELYALFIGCKEEGPHMYLFGPLRELGNPAYSHNNRVKYVVRYLYDIDNNGVLDTNDFRCLAVRNTIVESGGNFPADRFATNVKVMNDLWCEIALLADFDKNGEVDVDEFKQAVMKHCVGKSYAQFPEAFKAFIENQFKSVDVDGDGTVGLSEYRSDVITRCAFSDVAEIDDAYSKLVSDADKAAGGITLDRYKELYAEFIGNEKECPAMYLFGPLKEL